MAAKSKKRKKYKSKWHDPECEESTPLLMDNGTYFIKSGFAGDSAPRAVFPTIYGSVKKPTPQVNEVIGYTMKQHYIGDEAQSKRGLLNIERPIKHGIIQDFDKMAAIWHHTFYNELRVCPEEHAVIVSESPSNPKEKRSKTAEIMFETFNVPSMYLGVDATFAMYAAGRTTGVVLHSGDDISYSVPIYEGYALKDHVYNTYIGGEDVTNYLIHLLNAETDIDVMKSRAYHDIINDVKQKLGLIATDYNDYMKTSVVSSKKYELPDGRVLELDVNRFKCTECLFQPSFIGKDKCQGIHEILYESVQNHDFKMRKELFGNIVLEGGNTMFPGISERLSNELKVYLANGDNVLVDGYIRKHKIDRKYVKNIVQRYVAEFPYKIKVIASPERKYSVWIGASIFASTANVSEMFVTMDEYKENGANVVNTKCF